MTPAVLATLVLGACLGALVALLRPERSEAPRWPSLHLGTGETRLAHLRRVLAPREEE